LSCLFLFVSKWPRIKPSTLLVDLVSSVLLGFVWLVFLVLYHASPGAIEVVLTLCIAYLIEALANPFLKKQSAQKV